MKLDIIDSLPIAELHMHLDGSLEAELMYTIAKRNDLEFPYASVEATRAAYKFNNLQEFLNLYEIGAGVLRTHRDFYDLTMAYLTKANIQNVRHAEMFIGPQYHTWKPGVSMDMVMDGTIEAIKDAERKFGITSRLILAFDRSLVEGRGKLSFEEWTKRATTESPARALRTYEEFRDYAKASPQNASYVIGIGLDSSENGFPPRNFVEVYRRAKSDGYRLVAHAGEEGPPEYVSEALDLLHVERIDHGNRSLEDPALLEKIKLKEIPLDMCPLSNMCLKVLERLEDHPAKKLLNQGVTVNINSDDPAYFGGYVKENYKALARALNLSFEDLKQLACNSFKASFLSDEEKLAHVERIVSYDQHMQKKPATPKEHLED